MGWLDPPQPVGVRTRVPYRADTTLVVVAGGAVLVGAVMLAVGLGAWRPPGLGAGPRWLLALFGAAAMAGGSLIALRGWAEWQRRAAAARGHTAWQRDHPWPADGVIDDRQPGAAAVDALGLVMLVALLALLNGALVLAPPGGPRMLAWAVLGLLDLLAVGGLVALWRRSRPGGPRARLVLSSLPMAPGGRLAGELRLVGSHATPEVALRGITERVRLLRRGSAAPNIDSHCFYREALQPSPQGAGRWRVEAELPADAPTTQLSQLPVTYWELQVRVGGAERLLLLPVYAAGA